MEMSASESGESALSDLLKLNTSGGLSKHRYAFLEVLDLTFNPFCFILQYNRPLFEATPFDFLGLVWCSVKYFSCS
ncbi:hypothetical protein LguiA_021818 [Lonicera macranthoides]